MTGPRMRWDKITKLRGRRTLDYRLEEEDRSRDRAGRYLAAVERNQAQRRSRPREGRRITTQVSSV
jgi:hypothetical protein